MKDSSSPLRISPRFELLESRTVLSVDALPAPTPLVSTVESDVLADMVDPYLSVEAAGNVAIAADVSLEANPVETHPVEPAAETDVQANVNQDTPQLVANVIEPPDLNIAATHSSRIQLDAGASADNAGVSSPKVLATEVTTDVTATIRTELLESPKPIDLPHINSARVIDDASLSSSAIPVTEVTTDVTVTIQTEILEQPKPIDLPRLNSTPVIEDRNTADAGVNIPAVSLWTRQDVIWKFVVAHTNAPEPSARFEINVESNAPDTVQSTDILALNENNDTIPIASSFAAIQIDPSLIVHPMKTDDLAPAVQSNYATSLFRIIQISMRNEFELTDVYRETIGDRAMPGESDVQDLPNLLKPVYAAGNEPLNFALRMQNIDTVAPHMQIREFRDERNEKHAHSRAFLWIDFSTVKKGDAFVLDVDHRINRLVGRDYLFNECIANCSVEPEALFAVGTRAEKSEATLVGLELVSNSPASGSIPVVVSPITSELLLESPEAQSSTFTPYGMTGIAAPTTASVLDAALLDFLEQLDDIGRDITETLAANAWLTWAVAAGIGLISFDMARKKYRRFRSQVHGRDDESDSLSWFPGLPGPFSTQVS